MIEIFRRFFSSSTGGTLDDPLEPERLSRRQFVVGCAAFTGAAVASTSLLNVGSAEAASPDFGKDEVDPSMIEDDLTLLAQRRDRDDGWGRGGHRRDDRRGRRRQRGGGQRFNRRRLAHLCRNDRWFRRENRRLCRRVGGLRPRRGACVDFGGFTICGD